MDMHIPSAALRTVAQEHLRDTLSVNVLLRLDEAGGFHNWDRELTFDELRAGMMVSEKARAERKERATFRRTASVRVSER